MRPVTVQQRRLSARLCSHRKKKEAKKELKAAAQEKKKEERQQQFAALTEEEKKERILNQKRRKRERDEEKEQRAKKLTQASDNAPKVVVDLDFWDKMKEGEQISLVSQLGFCIGVNRKADAPCSLHYTRWDKRALLCRESYSTKLLASTSATFNACASNNSRNP